ncbi:MAG TPA: DUF4416 family protein [Pirellulales bacterium]|nr:DUF4416 family protein [Pirellulales bacterium]
MGSIRPTEPVLFIAAAFSRYPAALDWARAKTSAAWGAVALDSPRFAFDATDYYEPTMGQGIEKCFWAYEPLADPALLVERKLQANAWEEEYASQAGHAEPRPLNIDPGYLTQAKLVLASTKDHAHRIYLARGIFAEVTLFYKDRRWQERDWTFADYRRADYQAFFDECRRVLVERRRTT